MRRSLLAIASLGRLARSTRMLVAMIVVLAPLGLGPATGALARAFGASDHVCACHMAPGKCGCPTCARIERERERDRNNPRPVLESNCDHGGWVAPASALPPCIVPSEVAVDASFPDGLTPSLSPVPLILADDEGPPTPPPRV